MKKQLKTSIGISAFILSLVMAAPFSAFASNGQSKDRDSVIIRPTISVNQTVQINPNGAVTLRGTVGSIGSSSLVVKSWGGDWTVIIASTTKIISRSEGQIAIGDIKVGDVVGVHGTMKANAGLSVDARQIKDQFIPDRAATLRGTIASMGTNTFTVKSGDTTWTVNTTVSTKFSSKFNIATTLTAMKVGDIVVVTGTLATGSTATITATDVRDTSLPLNAVARVGSIANLVGNTFTLVTKQRNDQDVQVTIDSATAVTVNGKAGTSSDIKNDSKATVQGVLNTDTGVLSAVKVMINEVKAPLKKLNKSDDNGGRKNK